MEQRLPQLWKGVVRIQIKGEQTERFLNLCGKRGICIRNLKCQEEKILEGTICAGDFLRLGPIHRKTKVKIHILGRKGIPFLALKSKKRKYFCGGILVCICLLWFFSSHIWNIQVEGNVKNSTKEILSFLEDQGITHGMAGSRINCSKIAAAVRAKYPDITWVSVELEGSRLRLKIQEGIFVEKEEDSEKESCDLEADKEGVIVKMITREGVPQMKLGDRCKPGDLLISGRLEIKNDSQEVVRYEYVHAEGDVYVKSRRSYYKEIPLEYKKEILDGKDKRGFYLEAGSWYWELAREAGEDFHKVTEVIPVYLTESFKLPVSFGKITLYPYRQEKTEYSQEEVKAKAWQELQNYEEKLMEKGVQISANNVKIEIDHNTCISKGFLEIIQKTGTESPVERLEVPAERTAEDD